MFRLRYDRFSRLSFCALMCACLFLVSACGRGESIDAAGYNIDDAGYYAGDDGYSVGDDWYGIADYEVYFSDCEASFPICECIAMEVLHPDESRMFYPLVFNLPVVRYAIGISPVLHEGFSRVVSYEDTYAIFPGFDIPMSATAYYLTDGTLVEVVGYGWFYIGATLRQRLNVRIGVGMRPLVFWGAEFCEELILVGSVVGGVDVMVWATACQGASYRFYATFAMGDVIYDVVFRDFLESGQVRMIEVVNMLVIGGTDWLCMLADLPE